MPRISAPFTIAARPAEPAEPGGAPQVGRTTFDKVFAGGGLEGTSVVHFVSAASEAGPVAYVALERVEGVLDGREGAFVLRHVGAIVDGVPSLDLQVVPGTGTGGLAGLSGSGSIEHTESGARLELDYEV